MKVKCKIKEGITGTGYENMKFDEIREVTKKVADLLIRFDYVEEEVKKAKAPKKDK